MVRKSIQTQPQTIGDILSNVIKDKQSLLHTKTDNVNIVDIITFAKDFLHIDFSFQPAMETILKMFYIKTLGNDNLTINESDISLIQNINNYNQYVNKREGNEENEEEDLLNKYSEEYINIIEEQSSIWGGDYWLGEKLKILEENLKNPFHYLILVLGRRSGKSFISAIVASYEVYKLLSIITCMKCKEMFNMKSGEKCPICGETLINHPQSYYKTQSVEFLRIILAATKREQAIDPMLNYIEGFISQCSFFNGKWHRGDGVLSFKTEYDNIYLEKRLNTGSSDFHGSVLIKTVGGNVKGQHGMGAVLSIFDEFALFNQEGVDTDSAIIDAIIPASSLYRQLRGDGRIIMLSMPDEEEGKFYEHYLQGTDLYNQFFKQHLVFQIPTWEYNHLYTIESLIEMFGSEFGGDIHSKKFKQIYGAQFINPEHNRLIPDKYIDMAISKGLFIKEKPQDKTHRYYMHIDCASTGIANYAYLIGHWEKNIDKRINIFIEDSSFYWTNSQIREGYYTGKNNISYSIDEVIIEIIRIAKVYNIDTLSFDLMQSEESKFSFRSNGLKLKRISFSGNKQAELYGLLKQLLLENRIQLCVDDDLLPLELKNLRVKTDINSRRSKIFISQNSEIKTKDLADCLVGAIFSSYNQPLGICNSLPISSIYSPIQSGRSLFNKNYSQLPRTTSIFDQYRK